VSWLVRRLGLRPGRVVLDLAAGTGKLTRLLVPSGADVVAVEPLDEMRAELERAVPDVRTLAGSAEAIPLPDGSVDAVTVAQAFHWFRFPDALAELRRVLRDGGGLALLWNRWDLDDPMLASVEELLDRLREGAVPMDDRLWRDPLLASPDFGEPEERRFRHARALSVEEAVANVATSSVVAALDEPEREEFLARVRETIRRYGDEARFRYVTDVLVAGVSTASAPPSRSRPACA
jgi:SAM-dependent methyltransferase